MKYTTSLVVRTYECDSYNHVNNAVYLNYLEYGRMEFLHQINFDYKGLIDDGYYLYITHVDIRYKASAFLDDKLVVETESIKLRKVSGTFYQCIKKEDGTVCVEAEVTWACVTHGAKLSPLPEKYIMSQLYPENVNK